MVELTLGALGQAVRVASESGRFSDLVGTAFGHFLGAGSDSEARQYRVESGEGRLVFIDGDGERALCRDHGELLYEFEKTFIIDLQKLRPDLLYVHAAALAHRGRGVLLVAGSGTGKSTTALALLQRGLGYLSDELAPVELSAGRVIPFPQALCLKRVPPGMDRFPPGGLRTTRNYRLPVHDAHREGAESIPVSALFFLQRADGNASCAEVHPISQAEATARLYPQVLNALAHPAKGLDAVIRLAGCGPAYVVEMGTVLETAECIMEALAERSCDVA